MGYEKQPPNGEHGHWEVHRCMEQDTITCIDSWQKLHLGQTSCLF